MSEFDVKFSNEEYTGGLVKLEGIIERVIFSNEDNGYTICDMSIADDEIITVVGIMPLSSSGDRLAVWGKWVHNVKFGKQFSVEQYERIMPADVASILKYLSSRTVKGIGPKTAQRIVDTFGEDSFDVIENHPEWLADIKGMSLKSATAASESFREQAGIRSAMMFFREYFGAAMTVRIYKQWGSAAVDMAKKNPYRLCNEIHGIGFEKADLMASSIGIGGDSFDRLLSGIGYVLEQSAIREGHTCIPREKLVLDSSALLGVSEEKISETLEELLRVGSVVAEKKADDVMIFTREMYDSEEYIAKKLAKIEKYCPSIDLLDIDRFIEDEERQSGIRYASLQKRAISDGLRYGVMVLTGGPGTGKTTVIKALLHIFDSMGLRIALAAPTGRAAKKMSEATSTEAKTIHRLLEMSYDPSGAHCFMKNEFDLLSDDVIIVDEASMIDCHLMEALLKAIKPGARFIMIGDADQLPSVGAGNLLSDIIASERFATVKLSEIFRQAEKSAIITNAHAVNRGEMPVLNIKDNDFFFLRRNTDREIATTICELCSVRLPRSYGNMGISGTQVIAPSRKGEAGTENLNLLLQSILNPSEKGKREHVFRERSFREGDKVMQTRNNYDIVWTRVSDGKDGRGIFNGDIGTIEEIYPNENEMKIVFDDRVVLYDFAFLDDLEHAYAITVHKSQGSEYPITVIPMCSASHLLLTRNMLYTAITRAQNMVILVGREEIVREMVTNDRHTLRYTLLRERLEKV